MSRFYPATATGGPCVPQAGDTALVFPVWLYPGRGYVAWVAGPGCVYIGAGRIGVRASVRIHQLLAGLPVDLGRDEALLPHLA